MIHKGDPMGLIQNIEKDQLDVPQHISDNGFDTLDKTCLLTL